eukprot:6491957-Amphidinium_carterae.2
MSSVKVPSAVTFQCASFLEGALKERNRVPYLCDDVFIFVTGFYPFSVNARYSAHFQETIYVSICLQHHSSYSCSRELLLARGSTDRWLGAVCRANKGSLSLSARQVRLFHPRRDNQRKEESNTREAQRKSGRERIDAVARLINDAMVLETSDDNSVGIYQADENSAVAEELVRQSTTQYKQEEKRGMGKVEARARCGGQKELEDFFYIMALKSLA